MSRRQRLMIRAERDILVRQLGTHRLENYHSQQLLEKDNLKMLQQR